MQPRLDLTAITEVMPKARRCDISPSECYLDGYVAWSAGLNEGNKWGILVYVSGVLSATKMKFGIDFIESLWLKIEVNTQDIPLAAFTEGPTHHQVTILFLQLISTAASLTQNY